MRRGLIACVLVAALVALAVARQATAEIADCTTLHCAYLPLITKPLPTPTITPVPTPIPTPTTRPIPPPDGVCATNAPTPAEGAQAWMTVTNPARFSDTTLCVRLIVDGQVVSGATASGIAHYKTTNTALGPATTGADGVAQMTFSIGGASAGYTVVVDATVGGTYHAQTSFTPH